MTEIVNVRKLIFSVDILFSLHYIPFFFLGGGRWSREGKGGRERQACSQEGECLDYILKKNFHEGPNIRDIK